MKYIAFVLTLLSSVSFGAEGFIAPGGVWWVPKNRITVEKPVDLKEDTQWIADEIVVNAPVVTNGKMLLIVARRLVFGDGAHIKAFAQPALALDGEGPAFPSAAAVGATPGAAGTDGSKGKDGITGNPGMGAEGALPKEIVIFTASVEGSVLIDAKGQDGGKGGKGGPGQDGGSGAQGSRAICRAFAANTAAGTGGKGGNAGPGGKGGTGGQGGAPVPFQLLTAGEAPTGQKIAKWNCVPGAPGDGGESGKAGAAGKGGPGGLADSVSFIFNWETEPGGAAGADGSGADNSAAYQAQNVGAKGAAGPDVSPERWQKHVGRTTPAFVGNFKNWEDLHFQVALAWFEFHWWRLYERISRTSVALMVPRDEADQLAKDPLADLIPSGFDKDAIETIQLKWNESFLEPLQATLEGAKGRDERLAKLLEKVLSSAELFTLALTNASKRGQFVKSDVEKLRKSLESISTFRSESSKSAMGYCQKYTQSVLASDEFMRRKEILFNYFEVPACSQAADFLVDEGVQRPIEVALSFDLRTLPAIDGVVGTEKVEPEMKKVQTGWLDFFPWDQLARIFSIESAFAEDRKYSVDALILRPDQLQPAQIIEFVPKRKAAVVTGSMGLHKGYSVPDTKWDLTTLGKELVILRKLVQGERP